MVERIIELEIHQESAKWESTFVGHQCSFCKMMDDGRWVYSNYISAWCRVTKIFCWNSLLVQGYMLWIYEEEEIFCFASSVFHVFVPWVFVRILQ